MIQKPRGTKDIYGDDIKIYEYIFSTFEKLAKSYNIQKIITPTFESYELFDKTSGESSDIVSKEIYSFKDFGGRLLALKPEGTAPVGRAIIENKLYLDKKFNKIYYMDFMYRYDKPQKGRLRQFYQIGIEFINELNVKSILDTILLASSFLDNLSIKDYVLHINSLGLVQDRENYIKSLKEYFQKHKNELSNLSQSRIEINPLRILDDKVDSKLDVVKNAPKINQFWSNESQEEFEQVLKILDKLNIRYVIDHSLVRGLDYYSNIVYEFVSHSPHLGTQATLIGGGCYLDLVKSKSNPINGVGFGCGVERLFEIIKAKNLIHNKPNDVDVYFVIESNEQYFEILPIIFELRKIGILVEYNYTIKKFKKVFSEAKSMSSRLLVFQELNQQNTNLWTLKKDDENFEIKKDKLVLEIKKKIRGISYEIIF